LGEVSLSQALAFTALTSSLAFDFVARQAVGGTHMTYFILRQLPVPPPEGLEPDDLAWLVDTTTQLIASDKLMAKAVDMPITPHKWMPDERVLLRAAIDAYFMTLYGLELGDAKYVLDTFTGLNRRDMAAWGERMTSRLVLETMHDKPWVTRLRQSSAQQKGP